ncbi:MAG: spherulation-specific family 4 protein [Thermodesulfobacteriota bacterium]|nr:spherulation-specific family 4 protein [Thermodesulfobacteriota bacterium]
MKRIFYIIICTWILLVAAQNTLAYNVEMLYPLYNYPNWNDPDSYIWDDIAAAGSDIPITAIINPANGPGGDSSPNSDFQKGLKDLTEGGVEIIGYVATEYGTRNINYVKSDIKQYNDDFTDGDNYSVTGIFLDQVKNTTDRNTLAYYQELWHYVKNSSDTPNLDFVVLNPGINTPEVFLDFADVIIVFEGNFSDWINYTPDSYLVNYTSDRFSYLVHSTMGGCVEMENAIDLGPKRNILYGFVTDDLLPNPWDNFPSFWEEEVDDFTSLRIFNTIFSAAGTGNITIDVSSTQGAYLEDLEIKLDSDASIKQTGKHNNYKFLDGLASFKIKGLSPGITVQVIITFPSNYSENSKYYKVTNNGFGEVSNAVINGNTVSLTLTDGGLTDLDGQKNAEIANIGGLAEKQTDSADGSGGSSSVCCIATAAYESSMSAYLNVLREFRDRYMLTNAMGKAFVRLYYFYSPPIVHCISNYTNLRAIVRMTLLPFVGASWVALNLGPVYSLAFMLFLCSGFIGLIFIMRKFKR